MYHKFLNLAIAAIGFGALASCSSDDNLSKKEAAGDDHSYLAITVRSVGATPTTRAFGDSNLEDGTDVENNIEKIRFYFFDVNGNAFPLANADVAGGNYIDKTKDKFFSIREGETANIEKQVVVDVVSNTRSSLPVSVIAIVNPDNITGADLKSSMTIGNLRDASLLTGHIAATQTTPAQSGYATKDNTEFVMSNSVYDNNGASTCAALISGTNIATNQDDARLNPVDIYVERVAAKVRAKHADTGWTTVTVDGETKPAYKVGTTEGMSSNGVVIATGSGEDVYAVIDGWGIADESPKASLEKNIGGTNEWNDWANNLGFEPWTFPSYRRSFWELTPAANTAVGALSTTPLNHSFDEYKTTLGSDNDNTGVAYTLPNTPTEVRSENSETHNTTQTSRTKVLVAAHLMKKVGDNWVAADICEYKGQKYISEEDVKKAILNENTDIWVGTAGSTVRSQLTQDDISYLTFTANNTNFKDYQVKAVLNTAETSGKIFYTSETGTATITTDQLNERLGASPVNVRESGMTYYYTPIRHLADSDTKLGYFGVVRNHLYDITINSMGGFGTPVYDPNKTITPIIPTDEASYLSARINVLSWRIVSSTVDLNATE